MLELGWRIATATGERCATGFLLPRLNVAIQYGNASCVLGRSTVNSSIECQNLDDVYYLYTKLTVYEYLHCYLVLLHQTDLVQCDIYIYIYIYSVCLCVCL